MKKAMKFVIISLFKERVSDSKVIHVRDFLGLEGCENNALHYAKMYMRNLLADTSDFDDNTIECMVAVFNFDTPIYCNSHVYRLEVDKESSLTIK